MRILLLLLLVAWLKPAVAASNMRCFENPTRTKACPSLLYRSALLPSMQNKSIICICTADFAPLLQTTNNENDKRKQNTIRKQLETAYKDDVAAILEILNRKV